jgi:hypothetical protein
MWSAFSSITVGGRVSCFNRGFRGYINAKHRPAKPLAFLVRARTLYPSLTVLLRGYP